MGEERTVIIGAGIAGLAAAYRLAQSGRAVVVLEARDRFGGRMHTIAATADSPAVELGAEFIHGENVPSWPLIRLAGLATHEVPARHGVLANGHFVENTTLTDELERLSNKIDFAVPDLSVQKLLDQDIGLSTETKRLLLDYVEGFDAADPTRMSAQAFAKSERATSQIEGSRQFRIAEGYGRLIEWLVSKLQALGVEIHLQTSARVIRWKPGWVDVQTKAKDLDRNFTGSAVVITVPIAVLKSQGPAAIRFEPELKDKAEALAGIEVGHVTKVILRFDAEFWPNRDFGFVHALDEAFPTWWADERGFTLTGWAGGPRADSLRKMDEARLQQTALATVANIFAVDATQVRDRLKTFHHENWSADPFARGAYTYLGVGALDAPRVLADPIERTVFIAGEATGSHGQQGTVHGALESGYRAAEALLR